MPDKGSESFLSFGCLVFAKQHPLKRTVGRTRAGEVIPGFQVTDLDILQANICAV